MLHTRQEAHSTALPSLLRAMDLACPFRPSYLSAPYAEVATNPLAPTSSTRSLVEYTSRLSPAAFSSYFFTLKACYASVRASHKKVHSSTTICIVDSQDSTMCGRNLERRITSGYPPQLRSIAISQSVAPSRKEGMLAGHFLLGSAFPAFMKRLGSGLVCPIFFACKL